MQISINHSASCGKMEVPKETRRFSSSSCRNGEEYHITPLSHRVRKYSLMVNIPTASELLSLHSWHFFLFCILLSPIRLKRILLAAPDTNLLLSLTCLKRGTIINNEAIKVGIEEGVVMVDTDGKGRSVGVVADGVHQCDQDTVLGNDLGHAMTPICAKSWRNCAEEAINQ